MKNESRILYKIVSLITMVIVLICCIILSSGFGAVHIPFFDVLTLLSQKVTGSPLPSHILDSWNVILFSIRLPRVILGALVGMTLAIAGVVFQALFRNPLADPYLIGVSSGASFGATCAMYFVWQFSWGGFNAISIAAFCGGLLTMAAIYGLSRVGKRTPVTMLILAGVALGSLLTAGTTFFMFTAHDAYQAINTLGWLFGSLSTARWSEVAGILPYLGIGFVVIGAFSHQLNVLQLDDHQAQALGVNVERTKLILIFATTLVTAAAVSVSGIIGFIGLVVPHMVRLVWGPDHRFLLPMSGLAGAVGLILADSLARTMFSPRELPIGIVTALVGAPFFLFLLRKQKRDIM
ncbi:MAG: iron ABC transporter permease [Spirochaetales bacterium]|nr:iron ABC transporter permease [Spirochaetales bacterium]